MIDFFKEEERKEERGVSEEKAQLCLNFTIWFGHTNRWLCNLNTCGSCNANITVHSTLIDINLICANIVAIFSTTFVSGLQSSRTSPACRQRGQCGKVFNSEEELMINAHLGQSHRNYCIRKQFSKPCAYKKNVTYNESKQ